MRKLNFGGVVVSLALAVAALCLLGAGAGSAQPHGPFGIHKSVTLPSGAVKQGDLVTYTVVITVPANSVGIPATFVDELVNTNFVRFVEKPADITVTGQLITGTFSVMSPTLDVTISFVAEVNLPQPGTMTVTNQAAYYLTSTAILPNGFDAVSFRATRPYQLYLPLVMRMATSR